MFNNHWNDWSGVNTYSTQFHLEKALIKFGLKKYLPLMVKTPDGRYTAIFGMSHVNGLDNLLYVDECNFKIMY